jgi:ABC-type multidrug transport system permease subunit
MAQARPFRSPAGSAGVAPRLARRQVARSRLLVLLAALISFFVSVLLWFSGHESQGIFVGLWVPSILSFGALMLPGSQPEAQA